MADDPFAKTNADAVGQGNLTALLADQRGERVALFVTRAHEDGPRQVTAKDIAAIKARRIDPPR